MSFYSCEMNCPVQHLPGVLEPFTNSLKEISLSAVSDDGKLGLG